MSAPTTPPAESSPPAAVRDRAPRPAGLLPRHLQTSFVAGVAGLIVVVVLLPAGHAPGLRPRAQGSGDGDGRSESGPHPGIPRPVDQQARRLQAEQADLALTKQALTHATLEPETTSAGVPAAGLGCASGSVQATLEQDQAQRAYRALYADNLAWTTRRPEGRPPTKPDGRESSGPRSARVGGCEQPRAGADVSTRGGVRGLEGPDTSVGEAGYARSGRACAVARRRLLESRRPSSRRRIRPVQHRRSAHLRATWRAPSSKRC